MSEGYFNWQLLDYVQTGEAASTARIENQQPLVTWDEFVAVTKERDDLAARLKETDKDMDAIRYAAHMPADYQYGLPSWINQHLYGKLIMLLDVDGRVIRRSEDIEKMILQQREIDILAARLRELETAHGKALVLVREAADRPLITYALRNDWLARAHALLAEPPRTDPVCPGACSVAGCIDDRLCVQPERGGGG